MALSYPLTAPSASDQSSAAASTEQPTVVQGRAPTEQKRSVYRSDPALIQACINGDQSGWNELVDRYGRLVYSIPQRYGLSATDADDVFQNVFTIVLRRLESLRDQTRLSAWL
ncbi:MAG TPA: sigma factor, partial [Ardenticatenaceae bacterium]|nr:sigma factor [Ardenticatenaceae bacterium]